MEINELKTINIGITPQDFERLKTTGNREVDLRIYGLDAVVHLYLEDSDMDTGE